MGEIYSLLQTSSCSHRSGRVHSPGLACSIPLAIAVGSGMWPKLDQWDSIQGLFFFLERETLFLLDWRGQKLLLERREPAWETQSKEIWYRGKRCQQKEMNVVISWWDSFIIWKSCRCCDLLLNPCKTSDWTSTAPFSATTPANLPKTSYLLQPCSCPLCFPSLTWMHLLAGS